MKLKWQFGKLYTTDSIKINILLTVGFVCVFNPPEET
jgi:hypothetical protein